MCLGPFVTICDHLRPFVTICEIVLKVDLVDRRWIWTEDAVTHDSVFCRYVSDHKPIDCGSAAGRYRNDYPEAVISSDSPDAWDSYQHKGKWEGKIWHSELYQADCHANTAVFDWVDAKAKGEAGPTLKDDDLYEVALPFPFNFYNQLKDKVKISSNGYLTFSGEHSAYGDSRSIPHSQAPNDMVAVYWTDFDPSIQGTIHTYHASAADACPFGIASGEVCCAASCGTCGGSGCQTRGGGSGMCCAGRIRDAGVKCGGAASGGQPQNGEWVNNAAARAPCIIDGERWGSPFSAPPSMRALP